MLNNISYRVNEPHVISELIDGEVIILNFESGTYYSLNISGMFIWQQIQAGSNQEQIFSLLKELYAEEHAAVRADLAALCQTLEEESLIVRVDSKKVAQNGQFSHPSTPYEKPHLEKFTDLQSLLLLDPIHDVDEMGWPHQST